MAGTVGYLTPITFLNFQRLGAEFALRRNACYATSRLDVIEEIMSTHLMWFAPYDSGRHVAALRSNANVIIQIQLDSPFLERYIFHQGKGIPFADVCLLYSLLKDRHHLCNFDCSMVLRVLRTVRENGIEIEVVHLLSANVFPDPPPSILDHLALGKPRGQWYIALQSEDQISVQECTHSVGLCD